MRRAKFSLLENSQAAARHRLAVRAFEANIQKC